MISIANNAQDSMITALTVDGPIGICYFDPITEELLELSALYSHFMSVHPLQKTLRKYYLVVSPGETINYARVKLINTSGTDSYSAKVIISEVAPSVASFDVMPNFNGYVINNPLSGHLIPMWVLLESKQPINEIISVDIKIEYE